MFSGEGKGGKKTEEIFGGRGGGADPHCVHTEVATASHPQSPGAPPIPSDSSTAGLTLSSTEPTAASPIPTLLLLPFPPSLAIVATAEFITGRATSPALSSTCPDWVFLFTDSVLLVLTTPNQTRAFYRRREVHHRAECISHFSATEPGSSGMPFHHEATPPLRRHQTIAGTTATIKSAFPILYRAPISRASPCLFCVMSSRCSRRWSSHRAPHRIGLELLIIL